MNKEEIETNYSDNCKSRYGSSKVEFIVEYLDDYVRMAYRILIKKIDEDAELQLIHILYYLMDEYPEGSLAKAIYDNKIV